MKFALIWSIQDLQYPTGSLVNFLYSLAQGPHICFTSLSYPSLQIKSRTTRWNMILNTGTLTIILSHTKDVFYSLAFQNSSSLSSSQRMSPLGSASRTAHILVAPNPCSSDSVLSCWARWISLNNANRSSCTRMAQSIRVTPRGTGWQSRANCTMLANRTCLFEPVKISSKIYSGAKSGGHSHKGVEMTIRVMERRFLQQPIATNAMLTVTHQSSILWRW